MILSNRSEKDKAIQSESESGRLLEKLAQKEKELAEATVHREELREKTEMLEKEKSHLVLDLSTIKK